MRGTEDVIQLDSRETKDVTQLDRRGTEDVTQLGRKGTEDVTHAPTVPVETEKERIIESVCRGARIHYGTPDRPKKVSRASYFNSFQFPRQ